MSWSIDPINADISVMCFTRTITEDVTFFGIIMASIKSRRQPDGSRGFN